MTVLGLWLNIELLCLLWKNMGFCLLICSSKKPIAFLAPGVIFMVMLLCHFTVFGDERGGVIRLTSIGLALLMDPMSKLLHSLSTGTHGPRTVELPSDQHPSPANIVPLLRADIVQSSTGRV